jgi:hypothetical protein
MPPPDFFCKGDTQGWTLFNGWCYLLIPESEVQMDHEIACLSHDGHLTSVSSPGENTFVHDLATPGSDVWLGVLNLNPKDHPYAMEELLDPEFGWIWLDGKYWYYTNWAHHEPHDPHASDVAESSGDFLSAFADADVCVVLRKRGGDYRDTKWRAVKCTETHAGVCKRPAKKPSPTAPPTTPLTITTAEPTSSSPSLSPTTAAPTMPGDTLAPIAAPTQGEGGGGICCELLWTHWGDSCYKAETEKRDSMGGELACIDQGAHLAAVESPAENEFVHRLITPGGDSWIGIVKDKSNSPDATGVYPHLDAVDDWIFYDPAATWAVGGGIADAVRHELRCIYTAKEPSKLNTLRATLEEHAGSERALIDAVRAEFGTVKGCEAARSLSDVFFESGGAADGSAPPVQWTQGGAHEPLNTQDWELCVALRRSGMNPKDGRWVVRGCQKTLESVCEKKSLCEDWVNIQLPRPNISTTPSPSLFPTLRDSPSPTVIATPHPSGAPSGAPTPFPSMTPTPPLPTLGCPAGWTLNMYTAQCYQVSTRGNLSFPEQEVMCMSLALDWYAADKAHLTSLSSRDESDFVYDLLTPGRDTFVGGAYMVDVVAQPLPSAHDVPVLEGEYGWEWIDGAPWEFTAWAANEPKNLESIDPSLQLCVAVRKYLGGSKDRGWVVAPCAAHLEAVCRMPAFNTDVTTVGPTDQLSVSNIHSATPTAAPNFEPTMSPPPTMPPTAYPTTTDGDVAVPGAIVKGAMNIGGMNKDFFDQYPLKMTTVLKGAIAGEINGAVTSAGVKSSQIVVEKIFGWDDAGNRWEIDVEKLTDETTLPGNDPTVVGRRRLGTGKSASKNGADGAPSSTAKQKKKLKRKQKGTGTRNARRKWRQQKAPAHPAAEPLFRRQRRLKLEHQREAAHARESVRRRLFEDAANDPGLQQVDDENGLGDFYISKQDIVIEYRAELSASQSSLGQDIASALTKRVTGNSFVTTMCVFVFVVVFTHAPHFLSPQSPLGLIAIARALPRVDASTVAHAAPLPSLFFSSRYELADAIGLGPFMPDGISCVGTDITITSTTLIISYDDLVDLGLVGNNPGNPGGGGGTEGPTDAPSPTSLPSASPSLSPVTGTPTAAPTGSPTRVVCRSGWVLFKRSCYYYESTLLNSPQAEIECTVQGAPGHVSVPLSSRLRLSQVVCSVHWTLLVRTPPSAPPA